MRKVFAAVSALCAASLFTAADATVITIAFDVTASGFTDQIGSKPAPVDPVTGAFSVTFDNAADVQRSITGITVSNFNLGYAGTIGFSYSKQYDGLSIGIETTPDGYFNNTNEFGFLVDNVSTSPTSLYQAFDYITSVSAFSASSVTITPRAAAAVPEPATWMMSVAGFALAGLALRRRNAASARFV